MPCSKLLEDSALLGQVSCQDNVSFGILSAMKHARYMLVLRYPLHPFWLVAYPAPAPPGFGFEPARHEVGEDHDDLLLCCL
jgi:hypothetical protein